MKKFLSFFLSVILLVCLGGCRKGKETTYVPVSAPEIRIGVLLPLSGPGSSAGQEMQASVELARQDISAYLEKAGSDAKLVLDIADTRTDTAEALSQLRTFYHKGIRLIVGPYSSAELAHIKNFADANGMLIVSPSSVAVSLAIPDDNIFRFVTSDVIQGRAMSKLLSDDKIKVVVPLIRNDLWGNDLVATTGSDFTKTGGNMQAPVRYAPGTVDFSPVLEQLDTLVSKELEHHNPNDVAVYLISFSEGTAIMAEAKKHPHLNNIYWYGSSAFAQDPSIVSDTNAALFAYTHGLPCPVFGLEETAKNKWQPLMERITAMTGRIPDVYAFTAYDALWVLVRANRVAGGDPSVALLKSIFVSEAADYFGVTGNTRMDVNGDRVTGNYDFWGVKNDSTGYVWRRVARYNSFDGTISRNVR